ncbi:hypothetical protein LCFBJUUZ_CDS0067 [Staphylococcus phage PG-2021_76]
MAKNLLLYDKYNKVINTTMDVKGTTGYITIENLIPDTDYPEGEFYVGWEVEGKVLPKATVPEFTTLRQMREKVVIVYFSDLTEKQLVDIKGDSAYKIALDNGFKGSQEEWLKSLKGEPGEPGKQGEPGKNGVDITEGGSAYEIALAEGFQGTRGEWLESLKGEPGEPGEKGDPGEDGFGVDGASAYEIALENGFIGNIQDFLDSLKGKPGREGQDGNDGLSAYEIALENGFIGTEQEWIKSLKGDPGDPGEKGEPGEDGQDVYTTVYTMSVDMNTPFTGKKLFISYNQLMVTIMIQGNADATVDNIKDTDTLIAKLPDNVPLPKTQFARGTITSMTGGETVQYVGNIFIDSNRNIYLKFNKKGSEVRSYFGGSFSYPTGESVVNFNQGIIKSFEFDNPSFLSMQGTDYYDNYIFSGINEIKGDIQHIKYINTLDSQDKGTLTNTDANFSELVGHANSMKVLGKIGEEILVYVVKTDTPDIVPVYINMANKTTRVGEGVITITDENSSVKRIISINSIKKVNDEYIFDVYWYGINFAFKINQLDLDKKMTVSSKRSFSISEDELFKIRKDKIGDFGDNVRITQGTRIYDDYFYLTQYRGVTSSVFKFKIEESGKLTYISHWVLQKGNLDRFEIQDVFKINDGIYVSLSEGSIDGRYNNYIAKIEI